MNDFMNFLDIDRSVYESYFNDMFALKFKGMKTVSLPFIKPGCASFVKTNVVFESACDIPHFCGHKQFSDINYTWYGSESAFCAGFSRCQIMCSGGKCFECESEMAVVYEIERFPIVNDILFKYEGFSQLTSKYIINFNFDAFKLLDNLSLVKYPDKYCFVPKLCSDYFPLYYDSKFSRVFQNSFVRSDPPSFCYSSFPKAVMDSLCKEVKCASSMSDLLWEMEIISTGVAQRGFLEPLKFSQSKKCGLRLGDRFATDLAVPEFFVPCVGVMESFAILKRPYCVPQHSSINILHPMMVGMHAVWSTIFAVFDGMWEGLEDFIMYILFVLWNVFVRLLRVVFEILEPFKFVELTLVFVFVWFYEHDIPRACVGVAFVALIFGLTGEFRV